LFANKIVTYTKDFAEYSKYLQRSLDKLHVILPPVVLPEVKPEIIKSFQQEHNPSDHRPVIGMAVRFATEKGVEILLNALPAVLRDFPNALVLFAGPYKNIVGEENYFKRLMPIIEEHKKNGNWKFVGTLNPEQMSAFYPNLDVLVLPSLNSTEAFGLVQIEAMINGVPCVASNLPGVRQPVKMHAMGEIIQIGNSKELSKALLKIIRNPGIYEKDPEEIRMQYIPDSVAQEYEKMFDSINKDIASS
jgi:glycosyltransferase involved in cell wall biosynthesis